MKADLIKRVAGPPFREKATAPGSRVSSACSQVVMTGYDEALEILAKLERAESTAIIDEISGEDPALAQSLWDDRESLL